MEEKKHSKPKIFLVIKIVALVAAIVAIVLIICGLTKSVPEMGEEGWFEASNARSGLIFGGIGLLAFSLLLLLVGFIPELQKVFIKTTGYIVNSTADNLKDITSTTADIVGDGVEKVTRSVKQGLSEEEKKFCIKCGKSMSKDAEFCPYCGEKQEK